MTPRPLLRRAAPALLGLALVAVGCNRPNPALNPTARGTGASAAQPAVVSQRDIVGQIALDGEIVVPPSARADLLPPFRATVDKVNHSVGTQVEKGDILVELAMPAAEARHEQTQQALRQSETAYANAKLQFQGPVDAARRRLDAARAPIRIPTGPSDTASPAGEDPVAAQQELLLAKADREAQILPFRQRYETMREMDQRARSGEKQGYLRAPIAGTVTAMNALPGKEVTPEGATPIATIVDLSALQVQSTLTQRQGGAVRAGLAVVLDIDEIPNQTFEGRVSRLTTQPDDRGFVAIVAFRNTDARVRPGMTPRVAIRTGRSAKGVLAVPSGAVRVDGSGRPVVAVLREGKWQTVVVEPGISDTRFTQIKAGLKKDETVRVES